MILVLLDVVQEWPFMFHHNDRFADEPLASWAVRDVDVLEVPLLLPSWQVLALEQAAHQRGLTTAEMVRDVLRSFINQLPEQDSAVELSPQAVEALQN